MRILRLISRIRNDAFGIANSMHWDTLLDHDRISEVCQDFQDAIETYRIALIAIRDAPSDDPPHDDAEMEGHN
jgi:hypothetical protein